jgi:hypothetical protein
MAAATSHGLVTLPGLIEYTGTASIILPFLFFGDLRFSGFPGLLVEIYSRPIHLLNLNESLF